MKKRDTKIIIGGLFAGFLYKIFIVWVDSRLAYW